MIKSSPHQVVSSGLRKELKHLSRKRGSKKAAVAYVTSDDDVAFGGGDVLVCDASNHAIASGQTDATVLRRAYERSAELYSLQGLHAKLMLFGKTAIIGSANLSGNALAEAALITTDHVIHAGVASLIDEMVRRADPIDARFLDRISKIIVKRSPRPVHVAGRKSRFADRGSRTWLISVKQLPDDAFPDETRSVERGTAAAEQKRQHRRSEVGWIRFAGKSTFRQKAKEGDSVIQIWTAKGSKRPRVLKHSAILHVQKTKPWTRVYLEEDARLRSNSLSWTAFARLALSCGLKRFGKASSKVIDADVAEELSRNWRRGKRTRE